MRELHKNEIAVVSGAGIVTDNRVVRIFMRKFDNDCLNFSDSHPLLSPISDSVRKVAYHIVDTVDAILTDAYSKFVDFIGGNKELP